MQFDDWRPGIGVETSACVRHIARLLLGVAAKEGAKQLQELPKKGLQAKK